MIFFTLFFILARLSLRRSNLRTPTRLNVSTIRLVFIFKSRGESVARDGDRFTSINHGLYLLDMKVLLKVAVDEYIIAKKFEAGIFVG